MPVTISKLIAVRLCRPALVSNWINKVRLGLAVALLVVLGTAPGLAQGAPVGLTPTFTGAVVSLATLGFPEATAIDSHGNLFVGYSSGLVEFIAVNGHVSASSAVVTFVNSTPVVGLAADPNGNIFFTEQGNSVYELTAVNGQVPSSATPVGLNASFGQAFGLASDLSGDIFVSDLQTSNISKIVATAGTVSASSTVTLIVTATAPAYGIAVDVHGDLFATLTTSGGSGQIVEIPAGTTNQRVVNDTLGSPFGITVDSQGDLYVGTLSRSYATYEILQGTGGAAAGTVAIGSTVLPIGSFNFYGSRAVTLDQQGNLIVVDSGDNEVRYVYLNSVAFDPVAVGTTTPQQVTLNYTFTGTGTTTIGAPAVLTQGAPNRDFTDAGTGSCTTNGTSHSYAAGDTCTVVVSFNPTAPGQRPGAVSIPYRSGASSLTTPIYGIGTGPQVAFNAPATSISLGGGYSAPFSVAVDGSGNLYESDLATPAVEKVPNGCTSSTCMIKLGGNFTAPTGVALDGVGDVYVVDQSSGSLTKMANTCTSSACVTTLYNGFNAPQGLAVDGIGNIYVANAGDGSVREMANTCTSSACIIRLGGGFTSPAAVAVDGTGNVYVVDNGSGSVSVMPNTCTSSACVTTLARGFSNPVGLAVDAGGNVYVTENGRNAVKEIPSGCTSSSCVTTLSSAINEPIGVGLDGSGDLYVTSVGPPLITELARATAPTLTFPTATADGTTDTTDGPQTITLQNTGNEALTFTIPGNGFINPEAPFGFTFNATGGSACPSLTSTASTAGLLAIGASCNIPISFTPVAPASGHITGNLGIIDDAIPGTQSVTLHATAIAPIVVVPASPANSTVAVASSPAVAGSTVTVTATVLNASKQPINGATAAFTSTSTTAVFGTPSVSGNIITATMTDTVAENAPITVTLSGTASGTLTATAQFVAPAYVVTVATDEASGNGVAANCVDPNLLTTGNANCSLRDAVAAANALTGVTSNISFSGKAVGTVASPAVILIAQSGGITISQSVNLQGPGANLLSIEGGTAPYNGTTQTSNNQILQITGGNVAISGVTFANGYSGGNGGAINAPSGNLSITNCSLTGNQAGNGGTTDVFGGAIFAQNQLAVAGSTFTNNSVIGRAYPIGSGNGGAISANSTLAVSNSTFVGNQATGYVGYGGAIDALGTSTVSNSTFSGNSALNDGGGIYANSTLTVSNSTFSGDSALSESGILASLGSGTADHIVYNGDTFFNVTLTNSINGDPKLSPLGNYGGPTPTMLPLPGSAAICAGTVPTLNNVALTTDQRGVAISGTRYGQTACYDVGAVQTDYTLAFVQQPSNVLIGALVSPTPSISLTEDASNFVTAGVSVTDAASSLGVSPYVVSTSSTNGLAVLSSVAFNNPTAADTLTATVSLNANVAPALSLTATSNSFNVTPAVNHFVFTGLPATATAGVSFTGTVTAYASTDNSTIANGFTGPITFQSSDATAILPASTPLTGGVATGLSFTLKTAGPQTITVAASGTSLTATSSSIVVSAGAAASISTQAGASQSTIIGQPFATPLKVQVLDAFGNPAGGVVVTFSASASGASATFSPASCTTSTSAPIGVCSVAATANGAVGASPYTVSAKTGGVSAAAVFALTNVKATPALAFVPGSSALTYGQPESLTVKFSPASVLGTTPTASVAIFDNSNPLVSLPPVGGSVTLPGFIPPVGSHVYTASYSGDANFNASNVATAPTLIVSKASSTLTGPVATTQVPHGSTATIAVNVAGQYSGVGVTAPGGSVSYTISGAVQTAAVVNGVASIAVPNTLAPGSHTIPVSYGGDTNYNSATTINVSVQIGQITPMITFAQPVAITYGSTLGGILGASASNANATVAGTFTYTATLAGGGTSAVASSSVLRAGSYTLTANFVPTDTTTYANASATVSLTVKQASPAIAWATPASISYGTPLSATQLNASVTGAGGTALVGNIVYTPALGSFPAAGTQTLKAVFTPSDTVDYTTQTGTVSLTVNKASSALSGPVATGQSISEIPGVAVAVAVTVVGQFTGSQIAVPTGQVAYTIVNGTNITAASGSVTLTPGILSSAASVPIPATLVPGLYTVNLVYSGDNNFAAAAQSSITLQVGQIQPVVNWPAPAATVYGSAVGVALDASALNGTTSVPGTIVYTATPVGGTPAVVTAATVLPAGSYTLKAAFTPADTTTYKTATGSVSLVINKAQDTVGLATSASAVLVQNAVVFTATVGSAVSTPTGSVTFLDAASTAPLGNAPLVNGVAALSLSSLPVGSHSISAVYSGDANFVSVTSGVVSETVEDFNLNISTSSGSTTSQTIVPGGTAGYTLIISPTGSPTFPAAVALSVSGLPAGATYTLTPSTIAVGAGTTHVTLAIQVPNSTAKLEQRDRLGRGLAPIALGLLLMPFSRSMRRSARKLGRVTSLILLLLFGAGAVAGLTGCGTSSGYFGQSQQTYSVSVTGTSGALVHTTTVTLTVQ